MNKNGFVIGDSVVSIVTIIAVILIMGIFIFIASAIASIKKPEIQKGTVLSLNKDDLLFQTISVKLKNDEAREMLVYDALGLFVKGSLSQDEIIRALNNLEQKTGKCYYLSLTPEDILGYDPSRKDSPKDILFIRSKSSQGFISDYETIQLKLSEKNYEVSRRFQTC
jgi:hypothetical protein